MCGKIDWERSSCVCVCVCRRETEGCVCVHAQCAYEEVGTRMKYVRQYGEKGRMVCAVCR